MCVIKKVILHCNEIVIFSCIVLGKLWYADLISGPGIQWTMQWSQKYAQMKNYKDLAHKNCEYLWIFYLQYCTRYFVNLSYDIFQRLKWQISILPVAACLFFENINKETNSTVLLKNFGIFLSSECKRCRKETSETHLIWKWTTFVKMYFLICNKNLWKSSFEFSIRVRSSISTQCSMKYHNPNIYCMKKNYTRIQENWY